MLHNLKKQLLILCSFGWGIALGVMPGSITALSAPKLPSASAQGAISQVTERGADCTIAPPFQRSPSAAAQSKIVRPAKIVQPSRSAPMHITFEQSGGFAGLVITKTVDSTTLPPQEAQQLQQLVQNANFFELPAQLVTAQPDRFQYQITIERDRQRHTVMVSESRVPDRLKPLIDWLRDRPNPG